MKLSPVLLVVTWLALSAGLLWIAIDTGWMLAWLTFALISLMPTMTLMVIAQTPGLPVARLLHDRE